MKSKVNVEEQRASLIFKLNGEGNFKIKCENCGHEINFSANFSKGTIDRDWVKCKNCDEVFDLSDEVKQHIWTMAINKYNEPSLKDQIVYFTLMIISLLEMFAYCLLENEAIRQNKELSLVNCIICFIFFGLSIIGGRKIR